MRCRWQNRERINFYEQKRNWSIHKEKDFNLPNGTWKLRPSHDEKYGEAGGLEEFAGFVFPPRTLYVWRQQGQKSVLAETLLSVWNILLFLLRIFVQTWKHVCLMFGTPLIQKWSPVHVVVFSGRGMNRIQQSKASGANSVQKRNVPVTSTDSGVGPFLHALLFPLKSLFLTGKQSHPRVNAAVLDEDFADPELMSGSDFGEHSAGCPHFPFSVHILSILLCQFQFVGCLSETVLENTRLKTVSYYVSWPRFWFRSRGQLHRANFVELILFGDPTDSEIQILNKVIARRIKFLSQKCQNNRLDINRKLPMHCEGRNSPKCTTRCCLCSVSQQMDLLRSLSGVTYVAETTWWFFGAKYIYGNFQWFRNELVTKYRLHFQKDVVVVFFWLIRSVLALTSFHVHLSCQDHSCGGIYKGAVRDTCGPPIQMIRVRGLMCSHKCFQCGILQHNRISALQRNPKIRFVAPFLWIFSWNKPGSFFRFNRTARKRLPLSLVRQCGSIPRASPRWEGMSS